jgi:hypothetical protein
MSSHNSGLIVLTEYIDECINNVHSKLGKTVAPVSNANICLGSTLTNQKKNILYVYWVIPNIIHGHDVLRPSCKYSGLVRQLEEQW